MCRSTAEIRGSPLSDGALGRRTSIYRRVSGFLCLGIASTLHVQSGGTRGTDQAFFTQTRAGRARMRSPDQELKMILLLEYLCRSGVQGLSMPARASGSGVN